MPLRSANIETILFKAIEIGDEQARLAVLDKVCGKDADLRRDVERLIANHDRASDFLNWPLAPAMPTQRSCSAMRGTIRSSSMQPQAAELLPMVVKDALATYKCEQNVADGRERWKVEEAMRLEELRRIDDFRRLRWPNRK